jgi:hypothetical protein
MGRRTEGISRELCNFATATLIDQFHVTFYTGKAHLQILKVEGRKATRNKLALGIEECEASKEKTRRKRKGPFEFSSSFFPTVA